jgi:hypothetical protein
VTDARRPSALGQWGGAGSEFNLVDRKTGMPVWLKLRSEDGHKLVPDDVRLVPVSEE